MIFPLELFIFLRDLVEPEKSSLLKLMYAGHYATRGTCRNFLSRPPIPFQTTTLSHADEKLGSFSQEFRLLEHLTVFDNVALPLRIIGEKESLIAEKVQELLNWVGLGEFMYMNVEMLSGGQQQRANIARAVVTNPQFLLADEPTGNVDDNQSRRLLHLF